MIFKLLSLLFIALSFGNVSLAADKPILRIGVMANGTLAWELAVIQSAGLLTNHDFEIKTITLANQQAGKVALQSESVDIIVSDWIWVSSMRAEGFDYTFYPYSNSAGGLLVAANSPIKTIADLKQKKLGIAGGELDKNWLLLQALALKQGESLDKSVDKVYAAPPLLSQQLTAQNLDALLTYWQFAARLEAEGYKQLLSGEEIIRQLGISESVPSLGYVFKDSWARQNKAALHNFLTVGQKAKDTLCTEQTAWDSIAHLTEAETPVAQQTMRNRYCQGRVQQWGEANQKAAENLYQLLHKMDNNKLTAKHPQLQAGTFWSFSE